MKIIIENRENVNERLKTMDESYAVIGIAEPFSDCLSYHTQSNLFQGILKLNFFDCSPDILHDRRYIFTEGMYKSILLFVESMLALEVKTLVVHCLKGKHRSVGIALGLVHAFRGSANLFIVNIPDEPQPNEYVLSFFKTA